MNESHSISEDERWMGRAIELAERGSGSAAPNPLVGCVIVSHGQIVGQGWHERFGGPHAEPNALADAGDAARGATLYVNLEPCCHQGKTPPCTDAIIAAGIARVVFSIVDPNPAVAGGGERRLRRAGIDVTAGCLAEAGREVNAPYLSLKERGRPLVIAKWAQTADGLLTAPSIGRWITCDQSLDHAHRLRARSRGILVGSGTVLADNPELTTRRVEGASPHRFVLDGRLRTPPDYRLVQTVETAPLTIVTTEEAVARNPRRADELRAADVELLTLAPSGRPSWDTILAELGRRGVSPLLVEGGAVVLRSLFGAHFADRVAIFTSPDVGGEGLALWQGGSRPFRIAREAEMELGRDTFTEGLVDYA
jgi:diaminohydroxyphosphoribosylaminopyrimidine deaminase/5-amino-6-(5-phosphoribosylamino)uracil reductase